PGDRQAPGEAGRGAVRQVVERTDDAPHPVVERLGDRQPLHRGKPVPGSHQCGTSLCAAHTGTTPVAAIASPTWTVASPKVTMAMPAQVNTSRRVRVDGVRRSTVYLMRSGGHGRRQRRPVPRIPVSYAGTGCPGRWT